MSVPSSVLTTVLLAGFLVPVGTSIVGASPIYSDDFREHYPVPGRVFDLRHSQVEPALVVWDVSHSKKLTLLRTRGDKYGYDEQKCVITFAGKDIKRPLVVSILGFRNIEASWITEKLVLLRIGIGHVAAVDATYDTEKDKFIYCESVTYP